MDYFRLETLGNRNNQSLALVRDPPEGMGIKYYKMVFGIKAAEDWPEKAKIFLRPNDKGNELTDLLGNTKSYLLISTRTMKLLETFSSNIEIEYLKFTLYNQKKKSLSQDYWCANIIGGYDCLNLPESKIEYDEDGDVLSIKQLILDPNKLTDAPHIFRIEERKEDYVISITLLEALKNEGFTNILTTRLEQS